MPYYFNASGVTAYGPAIAPNTAETNNKSRQELAMTASNLFANVIQKSGGNALTFGSRVSGGAGAMSVSFSTAQSGVISDTTHQDSLAVGSDFDISLTSVPTATSLVVLQGAWLGSTTSSPSIFSCANDQLTAIGTAKTVYIGLAGGLEKTDTTLANAQIETYTTMKFSNLVTNIIANSIAATGHIYLLKNGAQAGPVITITSNQTGIIADTADTYSAVATDLMNYEVVTAGSGGGTMSLAFINSFGQSQSTYTPALSDSISYSATTKKKIVICPTRLTDAIGLVTDTSKKVAKKTRSEPISYTDAPNKKAVHLKTDALGSITDSKVRRVIPLLTTDAITYGAESLTKKFVRKLSDALGSVSEAIARITLRIRSKTDALGSVGDAIKKVGKKAISEAPAYSDSLTKKAVHLRTDGLGVVSDSTRKLAIKSKTESIAYTDASKKKVWHYIADICAISTDSIAKKAVKSRTDSITVTDSVQRIHRYMRLVIEVLKTVVSGHRP